MSRYTAENKCLCLKMTEIGDTGIHPRKARFFVKQITNWNLLRTQNPLKLKYIVKQFHRKLK